VIVGVNFADNLVGDVNRGWLVRNVTHTILIDRLGLCTGNIFIIRFLRCILFRMRLFYVSLSEFDIFKLVNGLEFLHGVAQVLDDLPLLLVEDGQHEVNACKQ
jgi:hypothetical protein